MQQSLLCAIIDHTLLNDNCSTSVNSTFIPVCGKSNSPTHATNNKTVPLKIKEKTGRCQYFSQSDWLHFLNWNLLQFVSISHRETPILLSFCFLTLNINFTFICINFTQCDPNSFLSLFSTLWYMDMCHALHWSIYCICIGFSNLYLISVSLAPPLPSLLYFLWLSYTVRSPHQDPCCVHSSFTAFVPPHNKRWTLLPTMCH